MRSESSRLLVKSDLLKRSNVLVWLPIAIAVVLLWVVFFPESLPESGDRLFILAAGLGIGALCGWPFLEQPLASLDVFEPTVFYRALIFFYYGLPTILFAFTGTYGPRTPYEKIFVSNPSIALETANYLFWFALFTLLAFDWGFKLIRRSIATTGLPLPVAPDLFKWALGLYMMFVIPIRGFQVASGSYVGFQASTFGKIPSWWALINYPAIIITFSVNLYCLLLARYPNYRTPGRMAVATLMFGEQYLFAFMTGSKHKLLEVTLNLLLVLWVSRAVSFMKIFLSSIVAALLIAPITQALRSIDAPYLRSLGLGGGFALIFELIPAYLSQTYSSLGDYLASSLTSLSGRTDGFSTASRAIELIHNRLEPSGGQTIVAAFYNLIPSFLWPGRNEIIRNATHFTAIFFGIDDPAQGGISISQAAEWYYNFGRYGGLIACAIAALAIGAIMGFVYRSVINDNSDNKLLFGWAIYLPLATTFLFVDFPLVASLSNGIRYTIIGLFCYVLLIRRKQLI